MKSFILDIKPTTNIRHDYNAFSEQCNETQAPIVITKNGEADLVVMSVVAYQKMMARQRLGQIISSVDKEIAADTPTRDFKDLFSNIEKRIENA